MTRAGQLSLWVLMIGLLGAQGRQFRVQCLIHRQVHLPGSIFVVTDSFRNSP